MQHPVTTRIRRTTRRRRPPRGPLAALAIVAGLVVAHPQPAAAVATPAVDPATATPAVVTFRYRVEARGAVLGDPVGFAAEVDAILRDPRGWSLGGAVRWEQVAEGGDLALVLASPDAVAQAAAVCSESFSCRAGDEALINDLRWREGSPAFTADLAEYRRMVVNHEVGHWLGLGHRSCTAAGDAAPVMQQQSIDLGGCRPNPWPLPDERLVMGLARGAFPSTVRALAESASGPLLAEADGRVTPLHPVAAPAEAPADLLRAPAVGVAAVPGGRGHWLVTTEGEVVAGGGAPLLGSMAGYDLVSSVVGIAAHPGGEGYWLVGADGGVIAFGAAVNHGSLGRRGEAPPVVGIAAHPGGEGYWVVRADGRVTGFGAARSYGPMEPPPPATPVVGIAAHPGGEGYWLVAADGSVFAFGAAPFLGSATGSALGAPAVGITSSPGGYRIVSARGTVASFGG